MVDGAQVAFNMTQYLIDGNIITGISDFYIESMEASVFYGLLFLGINIYLYIRGNSLEYVAILWLLLGTSLEIFAPGPALSIGKILMVVGIFLVFIRILLGGGGNG